MKKISGILILVLIVWLNVFAQNQVLTLDGDGDFVSFGTNLVGGRTDFTISAWIKAPSSYSYWDYSVLSEWESGGVPSSNNFIINFDLFNNSSGTTPHNPSFGIEQGSTIYTVNSTSEISAGNWYQIAVIKESDEIRILVNDVMTISACDPGPINSNSVNPLQIGNFGAGHYSELSIDEIRVWDYARTSAQIQNDRYIELTGNETDLIGYWNFESGTADDLTSNNINGTLYGNATISSEYITGFGFPEGSGTQVDPYQIANLNNLYWLTNTPTEWDNNYFIQTADIDANDTQNWNGGTGFSPVGNSTTNFYNSHFDGQGHNISYLYISRSGSSYQSLFGIINNTEIKNLNMVNVNITGNIGVGGVIGQSNNSSIINCTSSGFVTGASRTAGIVGENLSSSSIADCSNSASITAYNDTGGIAGYNLTSTINNCTNTGQIIGNNDNAGGIVGLHLVNSEIQSCCNTGNVSANNNVGGIAGYSDQSSYTLACCSYGIVNGNDSVGGIIGHMNDSSQALNCFSHGKVTGNSKVGGLIGANRSQSLVDNCYSIGEVNGATDVGGLIGWDYYAYTYHSFWDSQTSGQSTSAGGTVKNTSEMKIITTYTNAGWDFIDETANGTGDYWGHSLNENSGYPFLIWQDFIYSSLPSGIGTTNDPYIIENINHLSWLSTNSDYWGCYFIQINDIDCTVTSRWNDGRGFAAIGNSSIQFNGHYDGDGHIIFNLFINRFTEDNIGFFGFIDNAEVINLGLSNPNITGESSVGAISGTANQQNYIMSCFSTGGVIKKWHYNVGGLVGCCMNTTIFTNCFNSSTITQQSGYQYEFSGGLVGYCSSSTFSCCYNTGYVNTGLSYRVGGLVGCSNNCVFSNCFNTGEIVGYNCCGGLVGFCQSSTLTNSYNTGNVSRSLCGGILGFSNIATLTNCYSTGYVSGHERGGLVGGNASSGSVYNSFWDIQTSGNSSTMVGGTGKTTAEMKALPTYIEAGWDFMEETANGTDDYWGINFYANNGYPFLKWQGYTQSYIDNDIVVSSLLPAEEDVELTETESQLFQIDAYDPDGRDLEYSWLLDNVEVSTTDSYNFITDTSSAGTYSLELFVTDTYNVRSNHTIGKPKTSTRRIETGSSKNDSTFSWIITVLPITGNNQPGNCLEFDGIDDYVSINTDSDVLAGDFTVEAWVLPQHASETIGIFGSRTPSECGFDFKLSNGNLIHGDIGNGTTWITTNADASFTYSVDTWYHITYVVTSTGYEIFVNGISEGSETYTGTPLLFDVNHQLLIGNTGNFSEYAQAQIDEVRIWDNARTQTEILENMNKVLIGNEAGLIAYYKFNESAGSILPDASANNYIGTLHNMADDDWVTSTVSFYGDAIENVFISEICDNKSGFGEDTGFIELYNSGTEPFSVQGFEIILGATNGSFTADSPEVSYMLPVGASVPARGYLVIGNGATIEDFNTAWTTSLIDEITYYSGVSSLMLADIGHSWAINDGISKAILDYSPNITSTGRVVQSSPGIWNSGSGDETVNGAPGSQGSGETPLPVILSSFTAVYTNGSSILQWTTQSETNNMGWNIYRSNSENLEQSIQLNSEIITGSGTTSEATEYSYKDQSELLPAQSYWYWLECVDYSGYGEFSNPVKITIPEGHETSPEIPTKFGLYSNYPNPFNPDTNISFALKEPSTVSLKIFNIKGELVKTLLNNVLVQENRVIRTHWDGRDKKNNLVSSGMYFYQLKTDTKTTIKRMLLIK